MKKIDTGKALSRRQALKLGLAAGGTSMLPLQSAQAKRGRDEAESSGSNATPTPFPITPWQKPLVIPNCAQGRVPGADDALQPPPGNYPGHRHGSRPGGPAEAGEGYHHVCHGIAPEFDSSHPDHCAAWNRFDDDRPHHREYKLITEETTQEIIPGVQTPVFVYRDAFAEDASARGRTPGPPSSRKCAGLWWFAAKIT